MPMWYWDNPEQARTFVEAVTLATEGVVKGRRYGKKVSIPHGARHGLAHEVEHVARVLDEDGAEAVMEYARRQAQAVEEIKGLSLEELFSRLNP